MSVREKIRVDFLTHLVISQILLLNYVKLGNKSMWYEIKVYFYKYTLWLGKICEDFRLKTTLCDRNFGFSLVNNGDSHLPAVSRSMVSALRGQLWSRR